MTARTILLSTVASVLVIEALLSLTLTPLLRRWNAAFVPVLPKVLLWNASASAPRGLYLLKQAQPLYVGELVAVMPSSALAHFMAVRGYLPLRIPLLKYIAALAGQTVCRRARVISVDGHREAVARARDHLGKSLPDWHGCRLLRAGQVFVLNRPSDSFDSRYFGPLPATAITARAAPLLTEGAP